MSKLNPKWIRAEEHMSIEEFSYATCVPVSDVKTLEAEKRDMTDLEEQLIDAWRGGYKSKQIEAVIKELRSVTVPSVKKAAAGRGAVSFKKHFAAARYSVDRDRRMMKSAEVSRLKRQSEQDQRDADYYRMYSERAR